MTPITIDDEHAIHLIEKLADLEGENTTTVVAEAVQEKLDRLQPAGNRKDLAKRLMELSKRSAPLWNERHLATRHGDLLYDDDGLPK